ncbi:MAG TPA: hypothetical protein VKW04_19080 [Planctomycetota bacterium]|nr:hypothetical protein [Planctomycetota bacterium]
MRSLDDLTMYVYGLLDESAELEIRDHATRCEGCRAQVDRIAAEHRLLENALRSKTAPAAAPPPRPEKRGRLRR